jgi:Tfp pilus assembly protein PilF
MAHAKHTSPNDCASRLTWRAQGLMRDGAHQGQAALMLEAIDVATQAVAADPSALEAYNIIAWANWSCHLYRWGSNPAEAQAAMATAVGRMLALDPLDHRTLTVSGVLHLIQDEQDRGLADLHRAVEVNPNSSQSLMWLAMCEAMAGQVADARTHAALSLRLNPRDPWIGVAHVALALASFRERDYAEAARLAELAIQSEPSVPLRRAIMIACCAQLGDKARAERELAVLNGFAPDFIPSLFGKRRIIARTGLETIGRCLPPESGKFCKLFYRYSHVTTDWPAISWHRSVWWQQSRGWCNESGP